jgi:hypothetical protein
MSRPSRSLRQLTDIQNRLYEEAMSGETKRKDLAQVACAWERLEERKRILRMKPKPRDIDVTKPTASRRSARATVIDLAPLPAT